LENIYFSSTLLWHESVEQVVRQAASDQLPGIEIWAPHVFIQESDPRIIRKTKPTEMQFTMHAPSWDLNITSIDYSVRIASVNSIIQSIELADKLNADSITIHPGYKSLANWTQTFYEELMQEALYWIYQRAGELGKRISLELMEERPKEIAVTPDVMNKLVQPFSDMYTTFDVAHITKPSDAPLFFNQMDRCDKIHISDNTAAQMHVPLGTGLIPEEVLQHFLQQNQKNVVEGMDTTSVSWNQNLSFIRQHLQAKERVI
jgi:sugar phosphate isomerase/epimerase